MLKSIPKMQRAAQEDRKILKILCEDVYKLVCRLVTKHSEKQEEKTIVAQEELFVRSMQRDLFDSDIFSDFSLLYKDDCKIINIIEQMPVKSAAGFRSSMQSIVEYLSQSDNKQQLAKVADKYNKTSKYEWIFTQAVKKINTYSQKMTDQECEDARLVLIDLMMAVVMFQMDKDKQAK